MSALFGELGTPIVCPECGQPDRSTPTSGNDEVEAICERLETNDDDVSYAEVVALLRKQAAQIAELQKERAEILRISGLVWPPSTSIAGKGGL